MFRSSSLLACVLSVLPAIPASTAEWRIDESSTAGFTVTNMMITTVPGAFERMRGTVSYDPAEPEKASTRVEIDVASVNTGHQKRDDHLRSADFFEVARYPKMTFVSTGVTRAGAGNLKLTGNLTIRDVTRPVTFDVTGPRPLRRTPQGMRISATATTTISRRAFGLLWNRLIEGGGGVVVGDEVTITLKMELAEIRPGG